MLNLVNREKKTTNGDLNNEALLAKEHDDSNVVLHQTPVRRRAQSMVEPGSSAPVPHASARKHDRAMFNADDLHDVGEEAEEGDSDLPWDENVEASSPSSPVVGSILRRFGRAGAKNDDERSLLRDDPREARRPKRGSLPVFSRSRSYKKL